MRSVRSRYRYRIGPPASTVPWELPDASAIRMRATSEAATGLRWYSPSPNIGNHGYAFMSPSITVRSRSCGANIIVGRTTRAESPESRSSRSNRRL